MPRCVPMALCIPIPPRVPILSPIAMLPCVPMPPPEQDGRTGGGGCPAFGQTFSLTKGWFPPPTAWSCSLISSRIQCQAPSTLQKLGTLGRCLGNKGCSAHRDVSLCHQLGHPQNPAQSPHTTQDFLTGLCHRGASGCQDRTRLCQGPHRHPGVGGGSPARDTGPRGMGIISCCCFAVASRHL